MSDVRASDEADTLDVRVVEDRVDHLLVAVDHAQDTVRKARFLHQLGETDGHARIAFRRLDYEGVAAGDCRAEHPHRDHRGEVERGDPRADSERLAHRKNVNSGPCADGIFAFERLRDPAAIFDDLEPALNVAAGIGDDLAVLGAQELGQFLHVRFDQLAILEHDPRAALRIGGGPGRLGGLG